MNDIKMTEIEQVIEQLQASGRWGLAAVFKEHYSSLITTIESQKEEIEELSNEEVTISFNCEHCEGTGYNDISGSTGIVDDVDSCEQCFDGNYDVTFTHDDIATMHLDLQSLKAITELAMTTLKDILHAAQITNLPKTAEIIESTFSKIERLQNGTT